MMAKPNGPQNPDGDRLPVKPELITNGAAEELAMRAAIDLRNAVEKASGAPKSKVQTVERQSRVFTPKTNRVYRKTQP